MNIKRLNKILNYLLFQICILVAMISLKIKMPSKSFEVEIEDNASVVDLRKVVAEKVEKNAEQLVLIFGGKILKDTENLENHQIKDKMSVHLVIKQPRQVSRTYSFLLNCFFQRILYIDSIL